MVKKKIRNPVEILLFGVGNSSISLLKASLKPADKLSPITGIDGEI
jgi:hypothetical protein